MKVSRRLPPAPLGPPGPSVEHVLMFSLQHIVNTARLGGVRPQRYRRHSQGERRDERERERERGLNINL